MPRNPYRPEQTIGRLRQAEVLLGAGRKVPEVVKAIGISEVGNRRWRREYDGRWAVSQSKSALRRDVGARRTRFIRSLSCDSCRVSSHRHRQVVQLGPGLRLHIARGWGRPVRPFPRDAGRRVQDLAPRPEVHVRSHPGRERQDEGDQRVQGVTSRRIATRGTLLDRRLGRHALGWMLRSEEESVCRDF
jgi:hypothetical protein